jgi:argininosuccinate lyase
VVGGLVRECEARGCELNELPLDAYRGASPLFGPDVLEISVDSSLASRDMVGGPAPRRVREAAAGLRSLL